MILFECDIGYIPGSNASYDNKTIDEVTIVDSGRYLGIMTQYDGNFPNSDKTVEEFNAAGFSSFGDDFSKIWLIPYIKNGYTNTVWEYGWIPSAKYMYPNIWSVVDALANNTHINPIIIFRKLRKAISRGRQYEIRNNTFRYYSNRNTPYYGEQSYNIPIISNYTSGMDLTTAQWLFLFASTNTSGTRTSNVSTNTAYAYVMAWLLEDNPEPDKEETENDPYDPDGPSEPGGGDGEFDDPTEPVPIPDPPSISVADTGFVTLFNPSLSELKSLANYMWSDLFSVDSFKKIFADPMHAVLGLSIVPVNVPSAGSREVVVGNISTGVSMTVAAKQFVSVDCGSITVKKHWGAYLDYDPYTKSFIYLPYIGMHPVSTDDIMGRTIHIKYNVDILSGACTAFIESSGVVLYQFIGQVSSCIPITGDNFSNVINGVLGIAGSVGAMVATGGFSAPASVAEAGLGTAYTAGHFIAAGASVGQDIMNMKPSIEKSGAMSGTGGIMGVQKPYLIMMRPNAAIPGGQNQFLGYPAHITARLGDLSGFTQVEIIHLENIPCTEKEQEEILHYLAGGVIL